jgi:hypothetical protein
MKKLIMAALLILAATTIFANPLIGKWEITAEDYKAIAVFAENGLVRITSIEDDEILFWQYYEQEGILIIEGYEYKIVFITPDIFKLSQSAEGKEWMEDIMFTFTRTKEEVNGI